MTTLKDVAKRAGVSTATVSRVLNNLTNVHPATREKVLYALRETGYDFGAGRRSSQSVVTINHVAEMAEVSIATVSRVLNNDPAVRPQTRERIVEVMEKLRYRPNLLARQFRKKTTRMVGVVIPDISGPFFARVVKGIENIADQHGYQVVLTEGKQPDKFLQAVGTFAERKAEGALLMISKLGNREVEFLDSLPLPTVLMSQDYSSNTLPSINIDNEAAAFCITRYLLEKGYHSIAFLGGPSDDSVAVQKRLKGYRRALSERGITPPQHFIRFGQFSVTSGYKNCLHLLAGGEPPHAIFAANDDIAIGTIKALQKKGFSVPQNVAVAGFDDLPVSAYISPSLTTVHQPKYRLGIEGMKLLLQLINGDTLSATHLLLPFQLKIRESA